MKKNLIGCYVCVSIIAAAQQPAFEAASIKPSNYQGGPLRVTARIDADGINFSNVTPRMCIQRAYGLKTYQVTGPEWINSERYMIVAKAAGAIPQDKILLMLQTLLAERFQLAFHYEPKEMPVYALVVAKNGPKIKEAKDEGASQVGAGDGDEMVFERVSMGLLAGVLGRSLDRPVIDDTRLNGTYSFKLVWSDDTRPAAAGGAPEPGDQAGAPSIFTAVQERLGLKLEARRAPVDVLVIDHVEKPSGN